MYSLLEKADEAANPGLAYFNLQYKGMKLYSVPRCTVFNADFLFSNSQLVCLCEFLYHPTLGFFAVKATKQSHVAEFIVIEPDTILANYEDARAASGKVTADFACDVQLTTTAGSPGSLDRQDTCSAITFASERPAVWGIPVPASGDDTDVVELTGCGYKQCMFTVTAPELEPTTEAPTGTPMESSTEPPTDAPKEPSSEPPSAAPHSYMMSLALVALAVSGVLALDI